MTRIFRIIALALTLAATTSAFTACNDDDDDDVKFNAIQIEPNLFHLIPGNSRQLNLYSDPRGYQIYEATWSSLDPTVATVDQTGKVTAVSHGQTTIIAEFHDMTASSTVIVGGTIVNPIE